jgi:N-acetylneuraminic acid mutarotase
MLKGCFSHTCQFIVKGLHLLFVTAMLVAGLEAAPAQPTQAGPDGGVSPEGLLHPDGTMDLSTGFQGTLDLRGWEVTLDSQRGPILKRASQLATASDPTWSALPNQGLNDDVYALAVVGSDLYVGGDFTQTGVGALGLGRIARYDTTTGTWHALPNQGLDNVVRALAVVGSDLYVGGSFTQTGDGTVTGLGYIVRYDTAARTWNALPNQGLNSLVWALAVDGSDLYAGGFFTQTGDGLLGLNYIACYDTAASTWNALPHQGLNAPVFALAVVDSDLYLGGQFSSTGDGTVTGLGYIARYDTADHDWHALPNQGLKNGQVSALAASGSDLYVGGEFTQTGDGSLTGLGYIACYDTEADAWHALPNQGLDSYVFGLAASGSDLYVGGTFTQTGDGTVTGLNSIARYDTAASTWNALPHQGLNGAALALAVVGSDLYVGGGFPQTGDGSLTDLGHIARYDTTTIAWRAASRQGLDNDVRALAVDGSDLYVGGNFAQTGDATVIDLGRIARYDTKAGDWHALPHKGLNSLVLALAVVGSDLYVGGFFSQTGDGSLGLNCIARYDTAASTWNALPNQGLSGYVSALAVVGSDLYVGGFFSQTGDGSLGLNHIARYDTADHDWHALPNQGLNGLVSALAASGSDLYVGGGFTQTGDGSLTGLGHIARYDTTAGTWHALLNQGLNDDVRALAVDGSDLYVGGDFTQTGDATVTNLGRIARYDTKAGACQALPNEGLNASVWALAVVGSDLYVGGNFTQTGDGTVTDLGYIARYDTAASTWHALPNQGLNDHVSALAANRSDLYVGGRFTQTGDGAVTGLGRIARYRLPPYELFLSLVLRE